jgi:hypothetical protein
MRRDVELCLTVAHRTAAETRLVDAVLAAAVAATPMPSRDIARVRC